MTELRNHELEERYEKSVLNARPKYKKIEKKKWTDL
jgi:hypothetical protein